MVNVKQTAKSRALTKGAVKFGRLYMIDLAGSERASHTEVNAGSTFGYEPNFFELKSSRAEFSENSFRAF